jgi:hypothetical protein
MEPLQPPPKLLVLTQFCMAILSCARVWQTGLMSGLGQVSDGGGAAVTVKVAWQVIGAWQSVVSVKVTVVEPPQKDGGPVLLLVITPLQPPEKLAVANQAANWPLTAAWVWQAATVVLVGQVSTGVVFILQVNVRAQVEVNPQAVAV